MPKIGLISDTHSFLDERVFHYFEECDEIWHAGDFGELKVSTALSEFKPLRGVYGNIDGRDIRVRHPEHEKFEIDGLKVWMTHIGGYPGNYSYQLRKQIADEKPDLFISGHSHILKVMKDPKISNLLHINPGAAGKYGFHHIRTIVRFDIEAGKILNLQVIELGKRV